MFSPGSGRPESPSQARPLYSQVLGQEPHALRVGRQARSAYRLPASTRRSPLGPALPAMASPLRPTPRHPEVSTLGSHTLRLSISNHALELRRLYPLLRKETNAQTFTDLNSRYCMHLDRLHQSFRTMLSQTCNFSRGIEHLSEDLALLVTAHLNHMRAVLRPGAPVISSRLSFSFFPGSEAEPHRPAQIKLPLEGDYKICLPADYHLLQELGSLCPLQAVREQVAAFYRDVATLAEGQHQGTRVALDWRAFSAELQTAAESGPTVSPA
jgi:hypothetical protein